MNKGSIVVGNIQHTCFHDGPGIRTTVFLKGCSIRCPWCANPENLSSSIEYTCDSNICNYKKCPYGNKCYGITSTQQQLKNNLDICPLSAIKATGFKISIDNLFNKLISINNHDGITFSGGEPLLQSKNLALLASLLKKENINLCIETSLFATDEQLNDVIDYFDYFIVDIKILNAFNCKKILHGNIDQYYKNVDTLFKKNKKIIFRIPVADKVVFNDENIDLIINMLKKYKPLEVELFKLHNLAKKKYHALGLDYIDNIPISDDNINYLLSKIAELNITVKIIKF